MSKNPFKYPTMNPPVLVNANTVAVAKTVCTETCVAKWDIIFPWKGIKPTNSTLHSVKEVVLETAIFTTQEKR